MQSVTYERYVFIFEDEESSPISSLLLHTFKGQCGHFKFIGGNRKFYNVLKDEEKEEGHENTAYLLIFDLPVVNTQVVRAYMSLKDRISVYDNAFIFPVICLEHLMLKCLSNIGYMHCKKNKIVSDMCDCLVGHFDMRSLMNRYGIVRLKRRDSSFKDGISSHTVVYTSIEKLFKYVLNNLDTPCTINSTSEVRDAISGAHSLFYKQDCSACQTKCSIAKRYTLLEKAELLYLSFPAFDIVEPNSWYEEHLGVTPAPAISVQDAKKRFVEEVVAIGNELGCNVACLK